MGIYFCSLYNAWHLHSRRSDMPVGATWHISRLWQKYWHRSWQKRQRWLALMFGEWCCSCSQCSGSLIIIIIACLLALITFLPSIINIISLLFAATLQRVWSMDMPCWPLAGISLVEFDSCCTDGGSPDSNKH